jgi:hypothetical protein
MNRPDISLPIPSCWTPEEAMAFLAFLDQLISAIWRAYGDKMAPHLSRVQYLARAPITLGIHDHPELDQASEPDPDSFPF